MKIPEILISIMVVFILFVLWTAFCCVSITDPQSGDLVKDEWEGGAVIGGLITLCIVTVLFIMLFTAEE